MAGTTGIVALVSGKGGVAKTASALGISGGLKAIGATPDANLDLDYGASMTRAYGYSPATPIAQALLDREIDFDAAIHDTKEGIALIPTDASIAHTAFEKIEPWRDRLKELAKDRLLIIDTSDDIGSAAVGAAILAADVLCVPTYLDPTSYARTFPEIAALLAVYGHKPEIIWFAVMVERQLAITGEMLRRIAEDGVEIVAQIPKAVAVREAFFDQQSVVGYKRSSPVAKAYIDLATLTYARLQRLRGATGSPQGRPTRQVASTAR